jgi:HSP20 family protein
MTILTRWDPFRDLSVLQDRMNRLFQDFTPRGEQELTAGNFVPPVDIYEDEHNITVKAELPGIDPKDVDVRVESNTLTIKGERKFEKEEKEENFHRIERRYGTFVRSFTLPNTVDTENVKADYDNGVLKVQLEKRAEAKPKQIKVNIGQKTLEGKGKAA